MTDNTNHASTHLTLLRSLISHSHVFPLVLLFILTLLVSLFWTKKKRLGGDGGGGGGGGVVGGRGGVAMVSQGRTTVGASLGGRMKVYRAADIHGKHGNEFTEFLANLSTNQNVRLDSGAWKEVLTRLKAKYSDMSERDLLAIFLGIAYAQVDVNSMKMIHSSIVFLMELVFRPRLMAKITSLEIARCILAAGVHKPLEQLATAKIIWCTEYLITQRPMHDITIVTLVLEQESTSNIAILYAVSTGIVKLLPSLQVEQMGTLVPFLLRTQMHEIDIGGKALNESLAYHVKHTGNVLRLGKRHIKKNNRGAGAQKQDIFADDFEGGYEVLKYSIFKFGASLILYEVAKVGNIREWINLIANTDMEYDEDMGPDVTQLKAELIMVSLWLRAKEKYASHLFDERHGKWRERDAFFADIEGICIGRPEQLFEPPDIFERLEPSVYSYAHIRRLRVKAHKIVGCVMVRFAIMKERITCEFDDPALIYSANALLMREYFTLKRNYLRERGWRIALVPYTLFMGADIKTQNMLVEKAFDDVRQEPEGTDYEIEWKAMKEEENKKEMEAAAKDALEFIKTRDKAMSPSMKRKKEMRRIKELIAQKKLQNAKQLLKKHQKRDYIIDRLRNASKPTVFVEDEDHDALSSTARNDTRVHDILERDRKEQHVPPPGTLGLPPMNEFFLEQSPSTSPRPSTTGGTRRDWEGKEGSTSSLSSRRKRLKAKAKGKAKVKKSVMAAKKNGFLDRYQSEY